MRVRISAFVLMLVFFLPGILKANQCFFVSSTSDPYASVAVNDPDLLTRDFNRIKWLDKMVIYPALLAIPLLFFVSSTLVGGVLLFAGIFGFINHLRIKKFLEEHQDVLNSPEHAEKRKKIKTYQRAAKIAMFGLLGLIAFRLIVVLVLLLI